MKARRKSDGKIIEVETYMLNSRRCKDGSWESSYKDIDSGLVYESSELLFNLDYYTVIQGWVARDENGRLCLYQNEPEREAYDFSPKGYWTDRTNQYIDFPPNLFPDLTWDDKPEQVEIIIKKKKNAI